MLLLYRSEGDGELGRGMGMGWYGMVLAAFWASWSMGEDEDSTRYRQTALWYSG